MTQAPPTATIALERAVNSKDYRLGPGDGLTVNIWRTGKPANTFEFVIPPEGKLFFPALGDVPAAGLTLAEFRQRIGQVLARRLPGFQASVLLTSLRSFRVLVVGDVRRPGPVVANAVTRLTEVLAVACISLLGSYRAIAVRPPNGKAAAYDLYRFLATGDLTQNPLMNDGVTVTVPTAYGKVKFVGAVARTGTYEIKRGDRLRDILRLAGGVDPDAFLERAELSRILPAGNAENRQTITVNVDRLIRDPSSSDNVVLQPGDQFRVYTMSDLRGGEVVIAGSVRKPGTYDLTKDMRIRDLLFRSGGLLPDADLEHAQLQRLVNGQPTVTPLDLTGLILEGNEARNIGLQFGDVVIVPSLLAMAKVVFVDGRVAKPGGYFWRENETVSTLLVRAGGVVLEQILPAGATDPTLAIAPADLSAAYVERTGSDGKKTRIRVDLNRLIVQGDVKADLALQPGDVLVVPSRLNQVYVQGFVDKPGAFAFEANRTVRHYLGMASPKTGADLSKVVLRRVNGTLVPGLDTLVEPGDTVLVPETTLIRLLSILGLLNFLWQIIK